MSKISFILLPCINFPISPYPSYQRRLRGKCDSLIYHNAIPIIPSKMPLIIRWFNHNFISNIPSAECSLQPSPKFQDQISWALPLSFSFFISWEGELGRGTHVNPWLIHVNVWQKPLQYKKKRKRNNFYFLNFFQSTEGSKKNQHIYFLWMLYQVGYKWVYFFPLKFH